MLNAASALRYVRAHVRIHCGLTAPVEALSVSDLVDVHALLPEPAVSVSRWAERAGVSPATGEGAAEAHPPAEEQIDADWDAMEGDPTHCELGATVIRDPAGRVIYSRRAGQRTPEVDERATEETPRGR